MMTAGEQCASCAHVQSDCGCVIVSENQVTTHGISHTDKRCLSLQIAIPTLRLCFDSVFKVMPQRIGISRPHTLHT